MNDNQLTVIDNFNPVLPILIAGATASGKSALALDFARRYGGPIVNADALQVYDCWRLLSARPSADEERLTTHCLYGHISFDAQYSVGEWLREVRDILRISHDGPPIIVGGTGLYFSALTQGLADIPETPPHIRAEADGFLKTKGAAGMRQDLATNDPETLARIDAQNPMRLQRAWEVLRTTGRGLSSWQDETPKPLLPIDKANAFVLQIPKETLNERIDRRFDEMVAQGALDECRDALPNWDTSRPSSRAIGAPELISHLKGEIALDQAIEDAKRATRQYAKRQRTWFRSRMKSWTSIDLST